MSFGTHIIDEVVHMTLRLEVTDKAGNASSGTGFVVGVDPDAQGRTMPLLITNKHVIEGAVSSRIVFTSRKPTENAPDIGKLVRADISQFDRGWIGHPDPNVDLAAMPLPPLIDHLRKAGIQPFFRQFHLSHVADSIYFSGLLAIEPITMIGYPDGLWDSSHNLPISRRGTTATPLFINHNGAPEFMIDCACFPGSSGSPVFLLDAAGYVAKTGAFVAEPRFKLVGVMSSGPYSESDGHIVKPDGGEGMTVKNKMYLNLGYCIKADQLLWFNKSFDQLAQEQKKALGI